jgi:hypothetical protein
MEQSSLEILILGLSPFPDLRHLHRRLNGLANPYLPDSSLGPASLAESYTLRE